MWSDFHLQLTKKYYRMHFCTLHCALGSFASNWVAQASKSDTIEPKSVRNPQNCQGFFQTIPAYRFGHINPRFYHETLLDSSFRLFNSNSTWIVVLRVLFLFFCENYPFKKVKDQKIFPFCSHFKRMTEKLSVKYGQFFVCVFFGHFKKMAQNEKGFWEFIIFLMHFF